MVGWMNRSMYALGPEVWALRDSDNQASMGEGGVPWDGPQGHYLRAPDPLQPPTRRIITTHQGAECPPYCRHSHGPGWKGGRRGGGDSGRSWPSPEGPGRTQPMWRSQFPIVPWERPRRSLRLGFALPTCWSKLILGMQPNPASGEREPPKPNRGAGMAAGSCSVHWYQGQVPAGVEVCTPSQAVKPVKFPWCPAAHATALCHLHTQQSSDTHSHHPHEAWITSVRSPSETDPSQIKITSPDICHQHAFPLQISIMVSNRPSICHQSHHHPHHRSPQECASLTPLPLCGTPQLYTCTSTTTHACAAAHTHRFLQCSHKSEPCKHRALGKEMVKVKGRHLGGGSGVYLQAQFNSQVKS